MPVRGGSRNGSRSGSNSGSRNGSSMVCDRSEWGGELSENVIQYQDDSLGNLASRWHTNGTGSWLAKWWGIEANCGAE